MCLKDGELNTFGAAGEIYLWKLTYDFMWKINLNLRNHFAADLTTGRKRKRPFRSYF